MEPHTSQICAALLPIRPSLNSYFANKHTQMHAFALLPLPGANFATTCATRVGRRGPNLLNFRTPLPALARVASTTQYLQVCLVIRAAFAPRYDVVNCQRVCRSVYDTAHPALSKLIDYLTRYLRPVIAHSLCGRCSAITTTALLFWIHDSLTARTRAR